MSSKTSLSISIPAPTTAPHLWTPGGFRTDVWAPLPDDAPLPARGFHIISLRRWRSQRQDVLANPALSTGIALHTSDEFNPATDELSHVRLIALSFPRFTDGRAYSLARRLREQHAYRAGLRATGDVLYDQLPLMLRCGFDSFSITDAATIAALQRSPVRLFHRMYQSPAPLGSISEPHQNPHARTLAAAE